jgi:predicted DnaQ family exonuclease/DinG family helicase
MPLAEGVSQSALMNDPPGQWLAMLGLESFVALDLETTGLDPLQHQIIEVGAVRFRKGLITDEFRTFIKTDDGLDQFITDLTGITDADLVGAPAFTDIAPSLLEFIGGGPIVGQNIEFDLGFLRAAGERSGHRKRENPFIFGGVHAADTAMLSRVFWPELPGFALASLSDSFGVVLSNAHRALDDARATGQLLVEMIRRLPDRVWHELAVELHRLIGPTTHRSRFFFAALAEHSRDLTKPTLQPEIPAPSAVQSAESTLLLADLFARGGVFERTLPFFKHRPAQLELAQAVESSFNSDVTLLAEAPTGIGKSLAYLVPAVRWAMSDPEAGRQVVVSSHTKVLQDQLFGKDVAELRKAIDTGFRAEVLKGRGNYLCRRRLKLLLREAHDRLSELDRVALMPLLRWSELTTAGDITEINGFNPRYQSVLWSQVASDSLICTGSTCSAAKGDFYRTAQERAAKAQIVFVNHALLVTDVARYAGGPARRLVLDEAHQIERAMVGAMSQELSSPLLRNMLARLIDEKLPRGLLPHIAKRLSHSDNSEIEAYATDLISALRLLHASVRQRFTQLAEELARMLGNSERSSKVRFRSGQNIHTIIANALNPLVDEWMQVVVMLTDFQRRLSDLKGDDRLATETIAELRSAVDLLAGIGDQFTAVLKKDDSNTVTWVEFGRSSRSTWCSIYAAPISVGAIMQKSFWPVVESAVLTSATLTVGGKFDVLRESLGLSAAPETAFREMILGSPFRLAEQMRTFVPTFLPEPRQDSYGYAMALSELIARIVDRFPRGTLILSTSHDLVDRVTSAVNIVARKSGRVVLSQGSSGSLAELVAEFRKRGNAILVGTSSFWEGIDVVGDALQILIITRLPFDVPSEPWVAARSESIQNAGRDPFNDYSLPVAALRLKQGMGRLIRHPRDRGVAIIMDPRLFTSRYGRMIRDNLPSVPQRAQSEQELFSGMELFFSNQES